MASRYKVEECFVHPLVSAVTSQGNLPSPLDPPTAHAGRQLDQRSWFKCPVPVSKAIYMILLWNVMVGFTLATVIIAALALPISTLTHFSFTNLVYIFLGVYGAIGLIQLLFYPLGGLMADLRCGRFKTVLCSVVSIWSGYVCLGLMAVTYLASHERIFQKEAVIAVCVIVIALLAIVGFTGFQANAVQFGLDQLQDAPSRDLSVFLHWFAWMDLLGTFASRMVGAALLCNEDLLYNVLPYIILIVLLIISVLVICSYFKRDWFHNEPCTHNPYGTVYRVLKFVAKHDKPIRRSAMTFCDDERPTRIEFAKQRFGGPFTTETVEDVKTFLRVLVMLITIGPMFFLNVATLYMFPLFGMHVGMNKPVSSGGCNVMWLLFQSNNLSSATAIVIMPFYIILVHRYVPKWFPRILYRLGVGIVLLVLSVASMLVIEGTGHWFANDNSITNISCLFTSEYRENNNFSQTLEFDTRVLIVPNILIGIAVPLIYITILEFISAQSPHTMKGLLLGVFYGIRGFFIMLGCVFVIPFTRQSVWGKYDSKILNCGFYYYLMNTLFGIIIIMVFWAAAKWYQYREREDRPYGFNYVEDYYARYARGGIMASPEEELGGRGSLVPNSPMDYGTIQAQEM